MDIPPVLPHEPSRPIPETTRSIGLIKRVLRAIFGTELSLAEPIPKLASTRRFSYPPSAAVAQAVIQTPIEERRRDSTGKKALKQKK